MPLAPILRLNNGKLVSCMPSDSERATARHYQHSPRWTVHLAVSAGTADEARLQVLTCNRRRGLLMAQASCDVELMAAIAQLDTLTFYWRDVMLERVAVALRSVA